MDKPTLDYASPPPRPSRLPLIAFVCGIVSGPASVGLLRLVGAFFFPMGSATNRLAFLALAVPLLGAFALGVFAYARCDATGRSPVLAVVGWAASAGWFLALLILLLVAAS